MEALPGPLKFNSLSYQIHYVHHTLRRTGTAQYQLRELAHMHTTKQATEPEDKIFGLLGLANPETYDTFSADYTLSLREVYENVFRLMIEEDYGDLKFLTGSWFNQGKVRGYDPRNINGFYVDNLPSWIPNFGSEPDEILYHNEMSRVTQYRLFNASGDRLLESEFRLGDNATLHVLGIRVGIVKAKRGYSDDGTTGKLQIWFGGCLEWLKEVTGTLTPAQHEALSRTVVRDLRRNPNANESSRTRWERIPKTDSGYDVEAGLAEGSLHKRLETAIIVGAYGRKVFVSEAGVTGICPIDTEPGDEIWVLYGGRVPFILRPKGEEEESYRFVGECYYHGIMDGEAVGDETFEEKTVVLK
jgi:hypothetical protein